MMLIRLLRRRGLRFWKGDPITKIKYIITIYIYIIGPGGPGPLGPPLGSVPTNNNNDNL